jgi:exodeoxyribonuclease VII large subunit
VSGDLFDVMSRPPAPAEPESWSVSRVNQAAKALLERGFGVLRVRGEVTNFLRARSGHCYFTLRDDEAQLRCVMWRDDARRLPTQPEEGMEVTARGRLTLYPARGDVQLAVTALEAEGEGLWKLALERVRAKLTAEGLTDPARKRPLPRFPARVGIVTSPDGAALRDIVTVIRRRAPWTQLVLCGTRVQGEGAADEIAAAIRRLGRSGRVEVMIVGRGGGSIEDLWCFNEEVVARAIAAAPVPVISAVGHETDITIADLVADLRAPTPSAAAEAAVPEVLELRRHLSAQRRRLATAARGSLGFQRAGIGVLRSELVRAVGSAQQERRRAVRVLAGQLQALSPLAALARGYAVALSPEGRTLRARGDFHPGDPFILRVHDGEVACQVRGGAP